KQYKGDEKLHGKTTIVTGANTGIGYEVAKEFAIRGAKVILACRDMEKCDKAREKIIEESFNKRVSTKHLDLASMKSIRKFAEEVNKEEKFLDILVNNAGVMSCPRILSEDGFELQLGTNYLGHFLLTNLLLERMKSTGESKVINVTSVSHQKGVINFDDLNSDNNYDPKAAYDQSKLALVMFTQELAERLKDTKVKVYAVYPGLVNTGINRYTSFGKSRIRQFLWKPFTWASSAKPNLGAQTILYCALSPEVAEQSGQFYRNCQLSAPSELSRDKAIAKRLWATSEVWTKLKDLNEVLPPKTSTSKS
ncbi:hypothetical protein FSP39_018888, partial [Pinctada imbricata]